MKNKQKLEFMEYLHVKSLKASTRCFEIYFIPLLAHVDTLHR